MISFTILKKINKFVDSNLHRIAVALTISSGTSDPTSTIGPTNMVDIQLILSATT
jgi:hypothetical protein